MKASALILLGSLALASCSSSAPPRDGGVVPRPAVVPVVAAPSALVISVTGLNPPKGFVLDGRLDEWGSIAAPESPAPVPFARSVPGSQPKRREDVTQGPNPRNAPSQVALAIRPEGVLLAASLAAETGGGAWIGVGAEVPKLAPIGTLTRGGMPHELDCEYEQTGGGEGGWHRGAALPPEAAAACRAVIARYDALRKQHHAKFTRIFRLDRGGVRTLVGDEATPVEGAVVKVADRVGGGVTLEVSMPLAALPRMSTAPVDSLRMIARAASQPMPPDSETDPWVWIRAPHPIAFEPHADLRAEAFRLADAHTYFWPSLSYHPAAPDRIESVHYPDTRTRDRLEPVDGPLYQPKKTMGDVEIGIVNAYAPWLVVRKKGAALQTVELSIHGIDIDPAVRLQALVDRGGAQHAIFFMDNPSNGSVFAPRWDVAVIAPDGTVATPLRRDDEVRVDPFQWIEVEPFHAPDWSSFGLRGLTHFQEGAMGGPATGYEVVFRFDPKAGKYQRTARRISWTPRTKHGVERLREGIQDRARGGVKPG